MIPLIQHVRIKEKIEIRGMWYGPHVPTTEIYEQPKSTVDGDVASKTCTTDKNDQVQQNLVGPA